MTHLIDDHFVGVELEVFFLALDAIVAERRLTAQADGQVKRHAVAGVALDFGLALDDGVFAGADEPRLEVAFFLMSTASSELHFF